MITVADIVGTLKLVDASTIDADGKAFRAHTAATR